MAPQPPPNLDPNPIPYPNSNPNPKPGELMAEYLPEGTEGQTVVVEACRFKHLGAAATVMPGFDPSRGLQPRLGGAQSSELRI